MDKLHSFQAILKPVFFHLRLIPRYLYWALQGRLKGRFRQLRRYSVLARSGLFDSTFYIESYPDVRQARIDPIYHYLTAGVAEGRDPHPLFRTRFYCKENPDVLASRMNPLVHYLLHGSKEGRNPHPLFSERYYLAHSPDATALGLTGLEHYLEHGAREGRKPHPWFDSNFYYDKNEDVVKAGLNPLIHFVRFGAKQGRDPHPQFNIKDYYEKHPELLYSRLNPLEHFLNTKSPRTLFFEKPFPITAGRRSVEGVDRIIPYVAHFYPAKPRAGNELRMFRLLRWLVGAGYRPLLVLAPLENENYGTFELSNLADLCPDFLVVYRDGRVLLSESSAELLAFVNDEVPVPDYSLLVDGEASNAPSEIEALNHDRGYCYDTLIALMSAVISQLRSRAILVNYVFMTRMFPLFSGKCLKILDTHDLFSSVAEKVERFGVTRTSKLSQEEEQRRFERADLILAIQSEEEQEIARLVPNKKVITVGMDFDIQRTNAPKGQAALVVASGNPRNVSGVQALLKYGWPIVARELPEAKLLIAGSIGHAVRDLLPPEGVEIIGEVEDLSPLYERAKVVLNPVVAGTGIKIKTLEALCHFRTVITWPSGTEGLEKEIRALCVVARDWYSFARRTIDVLSGEQREWFSDEMKETIAQYFCPARVYQSLAHELSRAYAKEGENISVEIV